MLWISAALLKAKRAGVSFDKAHRVFSIVNDLEEDSYAEDALDRWAEFDWKKNVSRPLSPELHMADTDSQVREFQKSPQ